MEDKDLTRRQMVQRMALAIGGTLVAPTVLLESCSFDPDSTTAGPERLAMLDAIAETIIPRTTTAGARDARTGAFIDVMIRDCYYPEMQEKLNAGIQEIAIEGKKAIGRPFEEATQAEREEFLRGYDELAHEDADEGHPDQQDHDADRRHLEHAEWLQPLALDHARDQQVGRGADQRHHAA